jgi:hypothetical protein
LPSFKEEAGVQLKEIPPLADKVVLEPSQIVVSPVAVIVGRGVTVIVTFAESAHVF